ncbi:helix-turn-helix domain-containing protein [Cohnella herbarum]|uniref:Helix-turn-helix domain-containing protein n=1 Tax=Cohnella herbarum TaxID=2728023 RepID=A0A7Z2ZQ09_9BACL|nr:helix-turn-helix domain-containing protein [Cohnella herbarum]QJD87485.1 helix-turn-helix domain-containing protein [Cohnella herbarum]
MINRWKNLKNSYYKLLLISLLVFFLLSLTLLFVPLYFSISNTLMKTVSSHSIKSLSQTSYSVEFMRESANTVANQTFFNSTINQLLYAPSYNDIETIISLETLYGYLKSSLFIDSIYIYSSATGNVGFAGKSYGSGFEPIDRFFDSGYLDAIRRNSGYSFTPVPRKINGGELVYSYILAPSKPADRSYPDSIVINISAKWLEHTFKSLSNEDNDNILIVDAQGRIVNETSYAPVLSDLRDDPMIRDILERKEASGYFTKTVNGQKHLATYTSSPDIGWKFILLTPYSDIEGSYAHVKTLIVVIYALTLICGVPLCLFISKKLYKPYGSIKDKLIDLEIKNRENHASAKQNVLRTLLLNPSHQRNEAIEEIASAAELQIRFDRPYFLLLIQIDRYQDFIDLYNLNDRALIKYCIQNIAEEMIGTGTTVGSIDLGDDCVVVLANRNSDDSLGLDRLLEDLRKYIRQELKLSISVCVSPEGHSVADAQMLYKQAKDCILNKFFSGYGSILHAGRTLSEAAGESPEYPFVQQKQIIDQIMLGKIETAKQLFAELLDDLKNYTYGFFTQVILTFSIELNAAVRKLERNNGFEIPFQFNAFVAEINRRETIEEATSLFNELFGEIHNLIELKKNAKSDRLIQDIVDIVHRDYRDANLSLETIADRVNLSSSHIRRVFKKAMNQSVADYIHKTRMEHAKELLLSTKLSVADISDRVGFLNNTYFFTAFKKTNGITPAEFRNKREPIES